MEKKELLFWIKRNKDAIKQNEFVIKTAQAEIEFGKKIIEEIKKIKPPKKRQQTMKKANPNKLYIGTDKGIEEVPPMKRTKEKF